MEKSRRKFLRNSMVLGLAPLLNNNPLQASNNIPKSNEKLKILILGGTSFLGPHQIASAISRGHTISTFTRGRTKPTVHSELFNQVEQLVGDREDNLTALENRKWDVVIDNSGRRVQPLHHRQMHG